MLAHLGISHVSLAAHSFGTIYAINFLLLYPKLLHPERPYVAFWAPWVSPVHSRVKHLQAAGLMPASLIRKFSGLASFVNSSVMPVLEMSSGLSSAVTRNLKSSESARGALGVATAASGGDAWALRDADMCALDLDDPDVVKGLRTILSTFLFAESIDGAGQDAQLCLRKPRTVPWSHPAQPWEDLDDAVHQLKSVIANGPRSGQSWIIDAFHAESDGMVGAKGQAWFDRCWQGDHTGADDEGAVSYRSQNVKDSDHDFILDPVFGASEHWLKRVAGSFGVVDEREPGLYS